MKEKDASSADKERDLSQASDEETTERSKIILLCVAGGVLIAVLSVILGFLIGWFSAKMNGSPLQQESVQETEDWRQDYDTLISRQLKHHINRKSIEENLKWLTAMPRLAGTPADHLQARAMEQIWKSQGLDTAGIESYNVLLSYPGNRSNSNKVQIRSADNSILYDAPWEEADDRMINIPGYQPHTPPYGAYCESALVQGELVYVNYGDHTDFGVLANHSIDLRGKILLARYGWTALYDKALNAKKAGALAILVFPDSSHRPPADVPDTDWGLPPDGVQQGAVKKHMGDSLTPGYPSKEFAYRIPLSEAREGLCPIPVQPISYAVATELMKHMDDNTPDMPETWLSKAPHGRHFGGKMVDNRKVRVEINNVLEKKRIYNTFGMVKGNLEPDRLVIIGGHRDAWGQGAVDPGGGTAILLEISSAISRQLNTGWRPRRTIIFASWGGEEFGLIGSTEWVEERLGILTHKAVAYLNLDIVVSGREYLYAEASPLLSSLVLQSTQYVSHPEFPSLFDAWRNNSRFFPKTERLMPNSDFAPFYFLAGIPSTSLYYTSSLKTFPAYHSQYDTFDYVIKHIDPGFVYHGIMAELDLEILYRLSDSFILPFDLRAYGDIVLQSYQSFYKMVTEYMKISWLADGEGHQLLQNLEYCVYNFTYATHAFSKRLETLNITSAYQQRQLNDQLMLFERAFIDNQWQENKDSIQRHIIYTPNEECLLSYIFPGISDSICQEDIMGHKANRTVSMETSQRVHKQFAAVCHALHRAIDMITI